MRILLALQQWGAYAFFVRFLNVNGAILLTHEERSTTCRPFISSRLVHD